MDCDEGDCTHEGDTRNVKAKHKNNTNKRTNQKEQLERAYQKEKRIEQALYFGNKEEDEDLKNQFKTNEKQIQKLQKKLEYQKDQQAMLPQAKGKAKRQAQI